MQIISKNIFKDLGLNRVNKMSEYKNTNVDYKIHEKEQGMNLEKGY